MCIRWWPGPGATCRFLGITVGVVPFVNVLPELSGHGDVSACEGVVGRVHRTPPLVDLPGALGVGKHRLNNGGPVTAFGEPAHHDLGAARARYAQVRVVLVPQDLTSWEDPAPAILVRACPRRMMAVGIQRARETCLLCLKPETAKATTATNASAEIVWVTGTLPLADEEVRVQHDESGGGACRWCPRGKGSHVGRFACHP